MRSLLFCLAWLGLLTSSALADGSRTLPVAAGDAIGIDILGQSDISGVYNVALDGSLTVPGLGRMTGFSDLAALEEVVSSRIDTALGLGPESYSIFPAEFRPITVGGYVSAPGQFEYRPGLRVISAIALAGGRGGGNVSQLGLRIQVNQVREQLARSEASLASLLMTEARLMAQFRGETLSTIAPGVVDLIGETSAQALFDAQKQISEDTAANELIALKRIASSREINAADIEAQEAVLASLRRQLTLVREDLERIRPLIAAGNVTGARLLSLRKDYAEVEGLVGQAGGSLNQARTEESILEEEENAYDIQRRVEILAQLASLQTEIASVRGAIEAATDSLDAAGVSPIDVGQLGPGSCRVTLVRPAADGGQDLQEVDALAPLLPGDHIEVGRYSRNCPPLLPDANP